MKIVALRRRKELSQHDKDIQLKVGAHNSQDHVYFAVLACVHSVMYRSTPVQNCTSVSTSCDICGLLTLVCVVIRFSVSAEVTVWLGYFLINALQH